MGGKVRSRLGDGRMGEGKNCQIWIWWRERVIFLFSPRDDGDEDDE